MAKKVSSFIINVVSKISDSLALLVCLGATIFFGVIQIVVLLIRGEYKKIDFIRQVFINLSIILFQLINAVIVGGKGEYLLINLFACSIFFTLTLCMPIRRKKLKKEERELARFIDRQLHLQNVSPTVKEKEKSQKNLVEVIEVKPAQSKAVDIPIDYTHVKNVIERLNYFPLSVTDRRQVRELEGLLIEAERGEETPLLKSKINDGLGALLKIMSKHGA